MVKGIYCLLTLETQPNYSEVKFKKQMISSQNINTKPYVMNHN